MVSPAYSIDQASLRQARARSPAPTGIIPLSLAIIDVDHFKDINDSYGRAGGDIALRRVAEVCRSAVRSKDVLSGRWR